MTTADLQLALLVLNGLAVPGLYLLVRILWKMDRRLLTVELKLGIAQKDSA